MADQCSKCLKVLYFSGIAIFQTVFSIIEGGIWSYGIQCTIISLKKKIASDQLYKYRKFILLCKQTKQFLVIVSTLFLCQNCHGDVLRYKINSINLNSKPNTYVASRVKATLFYRPFKAKYFNECLHPLRQTNYFTTLPIMFYLPSRIGKNHIVVYFCSLIN